MDEVKDLFSQRREKLKEIKDAGINPYINRFKVIHFIQSILERYSDFDNERLNDVSEVFTIAGRLITKRKHGKVIFCHIKDFTGKIQLYLRKDEFENNLFELFLKFDIGDFIGTSGKVFKTKTGELTLWVKDFKLLSKSLRPLPEKWHGLRDIEIRYRQRYLDLIANEEVKKIFVLRSRIIEKIRNFLNSMKFLEVETPMMQPIPGGAAAKPFVTHHNTLNMTLYLRIAPELYLKRLIVGGLERVYEINKSFRNEGISSEHNPEFTMLEFYMAYADYNDLMDITEKMIAFIAKEVLGTTHINYNGEEIDLSGSWRRYTLKESMIKIGGINPKIIEDKNESKKYAHDLQIPQSGKESHAKLLNEIFERVVEPKLIQPTFITDYPIEISPLAKKKEDNPELVERFEIFIGGKEIGNAYTELNDPLDQEQRFKEQLRKSTDGEDEMISIDKDYIRALEYGMPPTAGEGIGIDRLVMIMTGSTSIRDVILFPQLKD
ncbi:MAG TPA: lysine--tRNA ligase [Nitrospinota bacterium]|nr:lysine--tRNA ligase [Nitrospinota bacterium]